MKQHHHFNLNKREMSKRKYSRHSDKVKVVNYECTNQKCKWQGKETDKAFMPNKEGWTDHICPNCGNHEFYGLLEGAIKIN